MHLDRMSIETNAAKWNSNEITSNKCELFAMLENEVIRKENCNNKITERSSESKKSNVVLLSNIWSFIVIVFESIDIHTQQMLTVGVPFYLKITCSHNMCCCDVFVRFPVLRKCYPTTTKPCHFLFIEQPPNPSVCSPIEHYIISLFIWSLSFSFFHLQQFKKETAYFIAVPFLAWDFLGFYY